MTRKSPWLRWGLEPFLILFTLLGSLVALPARATLQFEPGISGFLDEAVVTGLPYPTAVAFMPGTNGKMLVALKDGRVLAYNGSTPQGTFIDKRSIVHDNWDRGLIGLAIHPEFPAQPYVYLLYTHDPEGVYPDEVDPNYNGPKSTPSRVSQLMRVTADASTGYTRALAGSEIILLGKNSTRANIGAENDGENTSIAGCMNPKTPTGTPVEDCIPSDTLSHSIGTVTFGRSIGADGSPQPWSLYVGMGDASSFNVVDRRALRALNLDSLVGKILRINPDTGEGLPDNPFYNPANPNSNRSKVYSYGLRNPFRFTVNPASGEPFIGDVGWNWVEEVNTGKGANFGWPCYEGGVADGRNESVNTSSNVQPGYAANAATRPTCDALYAAGGGAVKPPVFAYNHVYVDGAGYGASINAGAFYTDTVYPEDYRGGLFIADYNRRWIRYMTFDTAGKATVHNFGTALTGEDGPVQVLEGYDKNIYWLQFGGSGGTLWRIRYTGAGNTPPRPVIQATPTVGVAPLTVNVDGSASFDSDNQALTYRWTIDDGKGGGPVQFATTAQATTAPLAAGVYTVSLTVTDTTNTSASASVTITAGTDPPAASIDQPVAGTTFKVDDVFTVHGCGSLGGQLGVPPTWEVRLHHNQHIHYSSLPSTPDPAQSNCSQASLTTLQHGDDIYYEVCATVSAGAITDTQCRSLQPQRPDPGYTLTSDPVGMLIQYENEGITVPGPTLIHPVVHSILTVTAADVQQNRTFTGWKDDFGNLLTGDTSYTFTTAATPKTFSAEYQNFPPTARIVALDPLTGGTPHTVRFDASTSSDPEGDVLSYSWDAGTAGTSDLASPSFSFPGAGSYPVSLTVSDQLGTIATGSVTVTAVANPPGNDAPTVNLTAPANGASYVAPASIALAATAADTNGSIAKVDFYAGSQLLGTDNTAPYTYSWANVPAGDYSLRALATDNSGAITTSTAVTVTVASPQSLTNLALGKPATASSVEGAAFPAGAAVDGSDATRWSSLFADPQWIYVDLQATYNINRVQLSWEAAYSNNFRVEVSPDAANWTTIYSTTTGTGGTQNLTGLSGTGRYVRVYCVTRATPWGDSLYEFEVYGTAAGGGSGTVTVTQPASQTSTVGTPASLQINATATPAGTQTYSATGLPAGLSINAGTGLISGTPTTAGTSTVNVTVTSTNGGSGNTSFSWTVNPAGGGSTNLALGKPATSSTPDSAGFEAALAVDGNLGTRWGSDFVDPQWLQIDLQATYNISRVKLVWEGAYSDNFRVEVSPDATNWTTIYSTTTGAGGTQDLTGLSGTGRYIRVYCVTRATAWGDSLYEFEVYGTAAGGGSGTVTVTQPASQTSTVGTPASLQINATATPAGTQTYSATGLPAGLSINAGTGLISGTPTTAGTSTVNVTVTSTNGGSGNTSFSWTVNPAASGTVTVTQPASQTSTVGTPASLQINATATPAGTQTYSATGLPAGLSINAGTGLISGTPTTAGTSTVNVTVTSTNGGSGNTSFSWTVNPAGGGSTNLALGRPATASSIEGAAFPAGAAVDGSAATRWSSLFADPQWIYVDLGASYNLSRVKLTWEAAFGSSYQVQTSSDAANWTTIRTVTGGDGGVDDLTGLSGTGRYVRIYGTVRGTPWGYSLYEFEVYGTAAGGGSGTVTVTQPASQTSTVGTPASLQINATATPAGTQTYGATGLPAGLSINAGTGLISGTPTTAGTSTVNVTVTSTNGGSGNTSFSWTVNPAGGGSTNLALGRPSSAYTASSTEGTAYAAARAFDGNAATRWSSQFSDPQWVRVDLGASRNITGVKLVWEAAYASSYKIQVSSNGSTWTDLYSTTTGTGGTVTPSVTGVGRYVRMYGTGRGTPWGYSLWEFEVYGTP